LRLFSFGGYGLALAALALVVFGAYDSYPSGTPLEGYSVFLSYESSMCKTEIKHPRVPFSNASLELNAKAFAGVPKKARTL